MDEISRQCKMAWERGHTVGLLKWIGITVLVNISLLVLLVLTI